ncbi:MAG: hypothetical protein HY791_39870 [Deltaproteobacteria bacterium]|nr:hypothetical protein [Deltaproteobacteria bacterium]
MRLPRTLAAFALSCSAACGAEEVPEEGLPRALPFAFDRPDLGEPVGEALRAQATQSVTRFFARSKYFAWIHETSHGVDASTGRRDYALWWHDVDAVKAGNLVTFTHSASGGAHNVYIPTSQVLAGAAAGYLATKDPDMAKVAEQYAKALTASIRGLVYDENDPNPYLMARNVVAQNHRFTLPDGREKAVDYSPWYTTYESWNAQRLHYPRNPDWGDIYVTNMRSKDDLPHVYAAVPWLMYLSADASDRAVKDAASEALSHLAGFAEDIVESGYVIRTKDAAGKAFVPTEDLASFVRYEELIPNAECAAKLGTAYIAFGESRGNACGFNEGNDYEGIATSVHYYNYHIVQTFHVAALSNALVHRDFEVARNLLTGLMIRIERYRNPESDEPGQSDRSWPADLAILMLRAAAFGMPLNHDEATDVMTELARAAESYSAWSRWNLWDPSVPDGTYDHRSGYRPASEGGVVPIEAMGLVFEYCASPLRNPAGIAPFDCDRVLDSRRWAD